MSCKDHEPIDLPINTTKSHCTVCHQTFQRPSQFDDHRDRGKCLRPVMIGLVLGGDGVWDTPQSLKKRTDFAERVRSKPVYSGETSES